MNEKGYFIAFCVGLLLGIIGAGLTARNYYAGKFAGERNQLALRSADLDREYRERQRELESGLGECIGIVENARAITERTGENANRAVGNIAAAIGIIRENVAYQQSMENYLSDLRARLYRLGDMGGVGAE